MIKEIDGQGGWAVTQGKHCKIRLLVKPSQAFKDWQASNPVVEPEPVRDLAAEIDALKQENIEIKNKLQQAGL